MEELIKDLDGLICMWRRQDTGSSETLDQCVADLQIVMRSYRKTGVVEPKDVPACRGVRNRLTHG